MSDESFWLFLVAKEKEEEVKILSLVIDYEERHCILYWLCFCELIVFFLFYDCSISCFYALWCSLLFVKEFEIK